MSEENQAMRWQTPISDAGGLAMVALVDRNGLHVTVEDLRDPNRKQYRISFELVAGYRNVLEEFRTADLPKIAEYGWTQQLSASSWLRELREREPLLDHHLPGCKHYVIATEDDVLEILSPGEPAIVEIGSAQPGERLPGKSNIYYYPADEGESDDGPYNA